MLNLHLLLSRTWAVTRGYAHTSAWLLMRVRAAAGVRTSLVSCREDAGKGRGIMPALWLRKPRELCLNSYFGQLGERGCHLATGSELDFCGCNCQHLDRAENILGAVLVHSLTLGFVLAWVCSLISANSRVLLGLAFCWVYLFLPCSPPVLWGTLAWLRDPLLKCCSLGPFFLQTAASWARTAHQHLPCTSIGQATVAAVHQPPCLILPAPRYWGLLCRVMEFPLWLV